MRARKASWAATGGAFWLIAGTAEAHTTCVFVQHGPQLVLAADCETDETIFIPDGQLLDGRGHQIVAVDPPAGSFEGAVVKNRGATAHVRNLVIATRDLAQTCHPDAPNDTRLRAIYFENASGSITHNEVRSVAQRSIGCQEGIAIEARWTATAPRVDALTVSRATLQPMKVTVADNRLAGYQKAGIRVHGAVDAEVVRNRIVGAGPTQRIAQNGIHISGAATARVRANHVTGHLYSGGGFASTGILLVGIEGPFLIAQNFVEDSDVGIRLDESSGVLIDGNFVTASTYDGISLDGRHNSTTHNRVTRNIVEGNPVGIDLFGAGAVDNDILANVVRGSSDVAVQLVLEAADNAVHGNRISDSARGILDEAPANDVSGNVIRP